MPRDGSQIVIPYQRRFHNRGVLLHVSILMTIGDFGRRSNIGSASRTRPLNSGLFLRDRQNDFERAPHDSCGCLRKNIR
jgi:hypothetical protein